MPANSWKLAPGLNNVGSFQVSGRPYATGSCLAPRSGSDSFMVNFPAVTSWFQIIPSPVAAGATGPAPDAALRVGFSENGLHGNGVAEPANYFRVTLSSSVGQTYQLKTSQLWFMEDSNLSTFEFDIVAGLTNIPSIRTSIPADRTIVETPDRGRVLKSAGPNWTGSLGVG